MNQVMKVASLVGMVGGVLYALDALGIFSIKTLLNK